MGTSEFALAFVTISIGIGLLTTPDLFGHNPSWAWLASISTQTHWGIKALAIGLFKAGSVLGNWKLGRLLSLSCGVLLYWAMTAGLIATWPAGLGAFIYGPLAALNAFALWSAITEWRRVPRYVG